MNRALVEWLMAPDAPDERLTPRGLPAPGRVQGVGPSDYVRGPRGNYEAVRGLCGDCPVRQDCLDAALADDSLVGLCGNTTEVERREIRRRLAA